MNSNINIDYLLNSAAVGDIGHVKMFIEYCNVDVNSTDSIGRTALHKAAFKGKSSIVKYLLSKGANVNSKIECDNREFSGGTPLTFSVMSGHVDIAKTLIQYGANVDVMVNTFNLLGIAIMSDNPSMLNLALSYSTGIDEYDCESRTPLIIALGNYKYESARFLLEKGADYKKYSPGLYPLLAITVQENGVSKGTELLLKHVEEKEGKEGLVEYINTIHSNSGRTALHFACLVQNYHTVKVLLERGADYKIRDKKGLEPDDLAIGDSHSTRQIWYLFRSYRQNDLATGHNSLC